VFERVAGNVNVDVNVTQTPYHRRHNASIHLYYLWMPRGAIMWWSCHQRQIHPVIKGRRFWQDDAVKRHDDSGILVARMRRCICVIPAYVDARHVLPAFFLRSRICHSHQRQAFVLGNPELFARVSRERLFVSGPPPPPGVFFLGLGAKSRNHSSRGVHRWCLHGPA
jgi:hypothetical protein